MKRKICMVVQDPLVKGGIAAVVNGYRGSRLEKDYDILYVESYRDGGKLAKLLKAIRGYFRFAKVLLMDKPDLVHIHSSFGASFYRKIPFIYMANWAHKPVINHIHGADFSEFYSTAGAKKQRLISRMYNRCDCLIALSEEWKANLQRIVPPEKIFVIENYSILHSDAVQQRFSHPGSGRVLFLGELGKRKGCYDIPRVLEQVLPQVPQVKFILCGAGTEAKAIRERFEQKNLLDHVEFPGWVRGNTKDRMLRNADVFFLPSYHEGMPMSILDAMGYGLPIVSTDAGGISKIVHNGENGFLSEPGNISQFADAIVCLLRDEKLRKKMGLESLQMIQSGYSLERHLDRLETLYNQFL